MLLVSCRGVDRVLLLIGYCLYVLVQKMVRSHIQLVVMTCNHNSCRITIHTYAAFLALEQLNCSLTFNIAYIYNRPMVI